MDYKKLEENVMRHLDSMTDEELQADFDRHVEKYTENLVSDIEKETEMTTNFEKWKENLTPESLIADNGQVGLWCCICPARKDYRKCLACGYTTNCNEQEFLDWLNKTERVDKWAKENPRAAEALGYDVPNDVKELMKRSSEMRKEKKTDNDTEPTALAKSPFPTREELDELNEIGLAGVIKKRERQERWNAIWFWIMLLLSSICGGVVGTVLYRWLQG